VSQRDALVLVIAAGAVTQLLRYVPVLLLRWRGGEMPPALARALEAAGMATIGGLIALAVFRPSPPEIALAPAVDLGLKLLSLALAFVLYLWFKRPVPALLIAYSGYVLLTLALAPG
jgi:hypothetical protein